MEPSNEKTNELKERHGCVTAWLILMIITNSLIALLYLFAGHDSRKKYSKAVFETRNC